MLSKLFKQKDIKEIVIKGIPGKDGVVTLMFEGQVVTKHEGELVIKGIKGDKGEDGITPNLQDIISTVLARIPLPENGKDGISPVIDYSLIKQQVLEEIPTPKDGQDGSPDTGEQIIQKIKGLYSYKDLKDLPDIFKQPKGYGAGYLKELGDVSINSEPTNNQVLSWSTTLHRWIATTISTGATPAGFDTQIQYNNAGAFGADAGLVYSVVDQTLGVQKIGDVSGPAQIDFNAHQISDGTSIALDWLTRQLYNNSGNTIADWSGTYLSLNGVANAILDTSLLSTTDKTFKFPNASGTFALTSDIGIHTLGGLSGATQTFATGTAGTDFAISSSGTTHTFNIPDASTTARGLITAANQTLGGVKSFQQSGGGTGTGAIIIARQGSNSTAVNTRQDSPRVGYLARAWNGTTNVNNQMEWYQHGIASLNPMQWVMALVPDNTSPTSEKVSFRWDGTNMKLGLNGITAPNAQLHLQAGTATAGTAPFKLSSGTNMTSAEAGAMEYDGTSLFFSPSTTRLRSVLTNNTIPSNGQLPIGNGTNYTNATLTAGTGVSVTNASGSITIANTGATTVNSGNTDYIIVTPTSGAVSVNQNRLIREQALSQKVTKVSGTTTETSLLSPEVSGTYTIDKATNFNFSRWEIITSGFFGEVSDKLRMRVYFGSTVIADFGTPEALVSNVANKGWRMVVSVFRVSSTLVRAQGMFWYDNDTHTGQTISMVNLADVTVDDMSSNNTIIDVTAEWGGTASEIDRTNFHIERTDNNP